MTVNTKWKVYIIQCKDGSFYVGITKDLELRLVRHNQGVASKYTRSRRPVIMVWHEEVDSESTARKREIQIKGWTRIKKNNLIRFGHPDPKDGVA